jgi:hypothetical protein
MHAAALQTATAAQNRKSTTFIVARPVHLFRIAFQPQTSILKCARDAVQRPK